MALVELAHVDKDYATPGGRVLALVGISISIEQAALCAIVGPSGSGKSTLLAIIGGLDRPTRGRVEVAGEEVPTMGPRMLARFRMTHVGFVFQWNNLVPVLTARENIALPLSISDVGRRERRHRVDRLIEELGLRDVAERRVTALSGGQQQRVGIARALAMEPTLILADEPTSHLDAETGHEVMGLMRTINEQRGTTFVFSTHDASIERFATQRIVLRSGRIAGALRSLDSPCRTFSA